MPFKFTRRSAPRFLLIARFGFFAGLSFALCNNTLQAWLAEANISPTEIGLFTLIALRGMFKFLPDDVAASGNFSPPRPRYPPK